MSEIKRIDPRRPYQVTPKGLRRIVAGQDGGASPTIGDPGHAQKRQVKPLRTRQSPVGWHMAIAHTSRGRLDAHAREALAAAAILASPETGIIAVILGELNDALPELGVDRIAILPEFDCGRFQPERELEAVEALVEKYAPTHIFMPDNAAGDGDLGRRLIAKHGHNSATHVVEIDREHVATPWSGGAQRALAELPRVILLDVGAVDAAIPFCGAGELISQAELGTIPASVAACDDLGVEKPDATEIALEEADFIVSGGNGVARVATLEALAKSLGAAIGASRVAVDDGKFSRDKQIGASGKTVSASAYIAVGISGAVQHLQGIKDCRHVIAFNRDAGAPIVKRADLTVIGDAEELMQALITRVSQARIQSEIAVVT